MILEKNLFVERILPASVLRPLSEEGMAVYRRPYLVPGESRRPTLTWLRELPIFSATSLDRRWTCSLREAWWKIVLPHLLNAW